MRPVWLVVALVWTVFSTFTTARDNFLPADLRDKLATLALIGSLPKWDWHIWALGILSVVVVATLEGSYRAHHAELVSRASVPMASGLIPAPPPKPQVSPKDFVVERKPKWAQVYYRPEDNHHWLSETEGDMNHFTHRKEYEEFSALLASFEAKYYVDSVRVNITVYSKDGKELNTVKGCWLEASPHNEIFMRVGDIRLLTLLLHAQEEGKHVYAVLNDRRNYSGPYADVSVEECPITTGGKIKIELFFGNKIGPEATYELFSNEDGEDIHIRSVKTQQTSEL